MNRSRSFLQTIQAKTKENLATYRLPAIILFIIAIVWLTSMPSTIGAINDPLPDPTGAFDGILQLMDDSGEFVIAWHTWGITHAPGYPLLSLIANIGVRLIDPLGLYPLTAAHLLSFLFALGAFIFMGRPIWQLTQSGTAVAAAYLLPAFGILVWLYAVVAEAYAFGLLLTFGTLWLALELGKRPTKRKLLLLGFLFGLAVGHHRTLVFLGPALLVAAWPARQLSWRVWLTAALLAAASLLVYLYLPLVAWAGSPWVYGRSPTTWAGFLDAFIAREYSSRLAPPLAWVEIVKSLDGRLRYLAQEMTGIGITLGLLGFIPGLIQPKTRRLAAVLLLTFLGYWLAPVSQSLLIRSYMMILVASLTLAAAWGVGLVAISQWRPWLPAVGLLLTIGVAINAFRLHQAYILLHTQDQTGAQMIEDAANLPGDDPVVGGIWGPYFFPLAYGKLVTGELPNLQLINLRGDLSGLPDDLPELIYTTPDVLLVTGSSLWQEKYGTAVALSSAGNRLVTIRQSPVVEPVTAVSSDGFAEIQMIRATAVLRDPQTVSVQLLWQAVQQPSRNYSIFIHITDKEVILAPEDIIVQGDRAHPVSGFYPTTGWVSGEQVQDNYVVTLPKGRVPTNVIVGLYTIDEDGRFINYFTQRIQITPPP